MAIAATAIWRVRTSGNNANGAGYDAGIAGAGTDYSQQDAAQLTLTDIACSNTTTATSATGGFTAAMIGNAIRITGGGATSGYYFITARTDTNTITVDRTPGTVSGGTGKVGGAALTIQRVSDSANSAGDQIVAGNVVYVRGAGTDDPSTNDYTYTTFYTPVSGSISAGMVTFISENGRARIGGSGADGSLFFNAPSYIHVEGFYFKPSSDSHSTVLIIDGIVRNCVFDLNDLGIAAVKSNSATHLDIIDSEFFSVATGTPTTRAGINAITLQTAGNLISGCTFHNLGVRAIAGGTIIRILNNLFVFNTLTCIVPDSNIEGHMAVLWGNTFDQNSVDCIDFPDVTTMQEWYVGNNIFANTTGTAVSCPSGTALNDRLKRMFDYNAFYANGTNYANLTAGANDQILSATPFTQGNKPTTDWSTNANVKALGFPHKYRNAAGNANTTSYRSIGLQF